MNTKHTPGPWWFAADAPDTCAVGSGDIEIATGLRRANARLIAAAPDLLAVMADLLADLDTIGFECDDDDVAGTDCVDTVSQHIERARAAIAKATGVTP